MEEINNFEGGNQLSESEILNKLQEAYGECKNDFSDIYNTQILFNNYPEIAEYLTDIFNQIVKEDDLKNRDGEALSIKYIQFLIIALLNSIRENRNIRKIDTFKIRTENEEITEKEKNESKDEFIKTFKTISNKFETTGFEYNNEFIKYIEQFISNNNKALLNINFMYLCQDEDIKKNKEVIKIIGNKKLLHFFLLALLENYQFDPFLTKVNPNPILLNKQKNTNNSDDNISVIREDTLNKIINTTRQIGNLSNAKNILEDIEGKKSKEDEKKLDSKLEELLNGFEMLASYFKIDTNRYEDSENPFKDLSNDIIDIFKSRIDINNTDELINNELSDFYTYIKKILVILKMDSDNINVNTLETILETLKDHRKEKFSAIAEINKSNTNKIKSIEALNNGLNKDNSSFKKEIIELEEKNKKIEGELNKKNYKLESLNKLLKEYEKMIKDDNLIIMPDDEELIKKNKNLNEYITKVNKQIEKLNQKDKTNVNIIGLKSKELNEKNEQILKNNLQLKENKNTIEEKSKKIDELLARLAIHENRLGNNVSGKNAIKKYENNA